MKINLTWFVVAFIVLLVLKLTNVVTWAWWIICIPLYPVAIALIIFVAILAFGGYMFTKVFSEVIKTLWR